MNNREADSGGPWYSTTTAYGFHEGAFELAGASTTFRGRVTYIDDALGVHVRAQ